MTSLGLYIKIIIRIQEHLRKMFRFGWNWTSKNYAKNSFSIEEKQTWMETENK